MDKMKPCPFCGRDMILCDTEFSDFIAYYHKGKHLSNFLCPFALGGTIHGVTKKNKPLKYGTGGLTMTDRERLIEMLSTPIHPRIGADPAEVVTDYLLDNGVIVPPCKIGDTVYRITCESSRKLRRKFDENLD